MSTSPKKRGFAALPPEEQKRIASAGGKKTQARGTGHSFNPETAAAAGSKGGKAVSSDREYMAEIGRKGGLTRAANEAESGVRPKRGFTSMTPERLREVASRGGSTTASRGHLTKMQFTSETARAANLKGLETRRLKSIRAGNAPKEPRTKNETAAARLQSRQVRLNNRLDELDAEIINNLRSDNEHT